MDAHQVTRADDMISAGCNIAEPEVEGALLSHPDVAECAVVGAPDAERGQVVSAYVVLAAGIAADALCVKRLQGGHRALHISTRGDIRRRIAENGNWKNTTFQVAPLGLSGAANARHCA